jgi:hypothetical protein
MKKMKTVFAIDRETRCATDVVQEQWVMDGEGVATIKHDGTSCAIIDGVLHRRFDAKHGKTPPNGWIACEDAPDPVTGHWPGWLAVEDHDPSTKWHREAFDANLPDGTYELVGPKVQSNRYGLDRHELWRHGSVVVEVTRTREALLEWLTRHEEEGLVFHHPDGRLAKLRRKDFDLNW